MKVMFEDHVWYQLKAMPYRTMDNVIDGVMLTLINIQQQVRQRENQLRRFATIMQDANDAITVQDFNGRILAWNKWAQMMYGWTQAEVLKMNTTELIPEETRSISFDQVGIEAVREVIWDAGRESRYPLAFVR
jgi:two-component system, chemotaxis family, CheB/CheR fusion protein